jgi:hypothetical protein
MLQRRPGHLPRPNWRAPLHWVRGFFHGFLAAVSESPQQRQHAVQRWRDRWQHWVLQLAAPHASGGIDFPGAGSLEPLRSALRGRPRGEVAAMLGPPPATSARPTAATGAYWYADTWYYPLQTPRRHAIAITFEHDHVSAVEHLASPGA